MTPRSREAEGSCSCNKMLREEAEAETLSRQRGKREKRVDIAINSHTHPSSSQIHPTPTLNPLQAYYSTGKSHHTAHPHPHFTRPTTPLSPPSKFGKNRIVVAPHFFQLTLFSIGPARSRACFRARPRQVVVREGWFRRGGTRRAQYFTKVVNAGREIHTLWFIVRGIS